MTFGEFVGAIGCLSDLGRVEMAQVRAAAKSGAGGMQLSQIYANPIQPTTAPSTGGGVLGRLCVN